MKKVNKLIEEIIIHLENDDNCPPLSFWKKVVAAFPEFKERSVFYKVIYGGEFSEKKFKEDPSSCALSWSGVYHYITKNSGYDPNEDGFLTLVTGEATVFNLKKLVLHLLENDYYIDSSLAEMAIKEEEVISFYKNLFCL